MTQDTFVQAAISNVAQEAVDVTLRQCRASGSDPEPALRGLLDTAQEMARCASEALDHLKRQEVRNDG